MQPLSGSRQRSLRHVNEGKDIEERVSSAEAALKGIAEGWWE